MEYNILDYGAIPDGKTLNTSRIQRAIDEASEYNTLPQGESYQALYDSEEMTSVRDKK